MIRNSNKTDLGFSFGFLFWNLTPLQTCPHVNIPYWQRAQVWVQPQERQIPSLEILFQVTILIKPLVRYQEISEKQLHFCGGPVNSLWAPVLQHKIFKSVDLRTLFALPLRNLPTGDKQPYKHFGSTNNPEILYWKTHCAILVWTFDYDDIQSWNGGPREN